MSFAGCYSAIQNSKGLKSNILSSIEKGVLNTLSEKIIRTKKILLSASGGDSTYLSEFWKSLLNKRTNFPDEEKLKNFLSNDSTYGYGNFLGQNSDDFFKRFVDTITPETPLGFLSRFIDPGFGGPIRHHYKGVNCSVIFLHNAPTSYRVQQLPLKNGLCVLEIGAGVGVVAYQLSQILDIKKYTIVDIPESLYLSYLYLSENTKKTCVFSSQEKIENGFEFAMPNQLHNVDTQFDLVINTISMGEMDLSMVETYKEFIKERLTADGFFFSINTHGKAGIKKPSQYLIDGMRLYSIEPWVRRAHNSFFSKLHYEIIQTKNIGEVITDETRKKIDYQGNLFIVGARPPLDKRVQEYEKGIIYYSQGEIKKSQKSLTMALDMGLTGFARTASLLILMVSGWRAVLGFQNKEIKEEMFKQAPILEGQINSFLASPVAVLKTRRRIRAWIEREFGKRNKHLTPLVKILMLINDVIRRLSEWRRKYYRN